MKKGKILFTGGSGFIGKQIIPFIEESGWEVIRPRSFQVRLEVDEEVATLFANDVHYDAIIHAAIIGGRRSSEDSHRVFYTNLNMFETLFKYVSQTNLFINFDSGASYGRPAPVDEPEPSNFGDKIPEDPYGFSKYIIAKRVLDNPKGLNLRIFGCFGQHEEITRFFNTNINNYIRKEDIHIIKDRKMDFIYANDLYKIVNYYLEGNNGPKDVNCVYSKKYSLRDIADIINNLDEHKVKITMDGIYSEFSYCGKSNDLPIQYDGLEKGIRDCYEYFCKRNI
jgi:GDP-L-fucose synthase